MNKMFLSAALVCSTIISFAQTSIYLKGGVNVSEVHVNAPPKIKYNIDPTVGFRLGAYFVPNASGKTNLVTHVEFSQRGFLDGGSTVVRLNYLVCSFLFSYSPAPSIGLELGPTFGVRLSATADGNDITDVYDTVFDAGATGGIRGNVSKRVALYAHYYYGLTKVDETFFGRDSAKEYNRVLGLGVGVKVNKIHE